MRVRRLRPGACRPVGRGWWGSKARDRRSHHARQSSRRPYAPTGRLSPPPRRRPRKRAFRGTGGCRNGSSRSRAWRPGCLRHPVGSAESCCLPALTRFTGHRRTGPDRHTPEREQGEDTLTGRAGGHGCQHDATQEGCESGRFGTLGKRVWGNSPWVRIPPPPRRSACASLTEFRLRRKIGSTDAAVGGSGCARRPLSYVAWLSETVNAKGAACASARYSKRSWGSPVRS